MKYSHFCYHFLATLAVQVLVFPGPSIAQTSNVEVSFKSSEPKVDTMDSDLILEPLSSFNSSGMKNIATRTGYAKDNVNVSTIRDYSIAHPTQVILLDGFGHELYLLPNDSFSIQFVKRKLYDSAHHYSNELCPGINCPWFHDVSYSGKNRFNYALFDSLAYVSGPVMMGSNIHYKLLGNDPQLYFAALVEEYHKRMDFITAYGKRHGVNASILHYARLETRFSFYEGLFPPFHSPVNPVTVKNLPAAYHDSLMAIPIYKGGIDDDAFFNTVLGSRVSDAYASFCVYALSPETVHDREKDLAAAFEERRKHFTGRQRDLLLSVLMFQHIHKAPENFDSLYTVYKDICSDTNYTHALDIAVAERSRKKISSADMLGAILENAKGDTLAFRQILGNKPIIIDCWASWCKPCMEQMPYSKKMEEKYGDKADFIYLSMDRSESAWKLKMNEINWTTKHFLLKENFKSAWADFFDIYSIPRYIVFDRRGSIFSADAARPGNAASFDKMMQELLRQE